MSEATVSTKTIHAALAVATAAGLDIPTLLARRDVTPDDLADPDKRFAHDVWLGLWRDIDASGSAPFGLRAAKAISTNHFDVLAYLVGASEDLGAGLASFERYFAIASTGVRHVLVPSGDVVRLERHYAAGAHTSISHPAEFAFAGVLLATRSSTGVPWRPREVCFAHPKPKDDREHRELFECPLRWDADVSAMTIDRPTLALPMLHREPGLLRVLQRHADAIVAALPSATSDLRARAQEAILANLQSGHASVGEIAKKLGMSSRTLQRRLGEVGTSHAELLDAARSQLALRYLDERLVSIAEIALLLGFTDVSAFHRAFRRWTDSTPAQHRRASASRSSG